MKYGTTNIDQEDKEKTALKKEVKALSNRLHELGLGYAILEREIDRFSHENKKLQDSISKYSELLEIETRKVIDLLKENEILSEICASARVSSVQPS